MSNLKINNNTKLIHSLTTNDPQTTANSNMNSNNSRFTTQQSTVSLSSVDAATTGSTMPNRTSTNRFTSNLAAVLNDPKKDRVKANQMFTKTWGYDFVDSASIPSINLIHSNYKNHKLVEFNAYINAIQQRFSKHAKNKEELLDSKSVSKKVLMTRINELEQIPKIFFDSNFCLSNKETFNSLISLKIFDNQQLQILDNNNANAGSSLPKLANVNGIINFNRSTNKTNLEETESCKFILDKLGFYLDIIETHITNQISTKANTFFNAIHSQDEVQEHVAKTCTAVKLLRKNLNSIDEKVFLASIRIIKLINLKMKYKNLIEKMELISSVYHTKSAIDFQLDSSEFTGALDLIVMSQEIMRQDLRGIRCVRNFDTQFNESEKTIEKKLHNEFINYIISDLSRDFALGSQLLNEEKLTSLVLGLLRLRTTTFLDLCKEEILIYLKSTVKQTVIEYVSQVDDDDIVITNEEETNLRLIDRIRKLKIPEFIHLLSKVLVNLKIMLTRVQSIVNYINSLINLSAGVKDEQSTTTTTVNTQTSTEHQQLSDMIVLKKELINKQTHTKLLGCLKELLSAASDYAQERLVNLLDGKFKANELERLSTNEFVSLSNLVDQFVLEYDLIANKKTSSLRSWLQNQANKFLHKFHNEKKDKITFALECECWKQSEVSGDIQNLIDHIVKNGLGTSMKKLDTKTNKAPSDCVVIENEKYFIFGTVIVLIKIMDEYCQFTNEIPNLCYDAMTRLIEIFTIFNSKTFKMILGVGAVESGILRLITFKTLAITYRSLELVVFFLPILKNFFRERLNEKQSHTEKQFSKLIGDYNEHLQQLNNKLIFMIDDIFRDSLSKYEVIAPVPSQCFRSICSQIDRVHQIVYEIFSNATLVKLFTDIHEKFKVRLKERLKELNVVNDGGPKHALIFQDMTYYIKQFKNLKGLHLITINFGDVWEC